MLALHTCASDQSDLQYPLILLSAASVPKGLSIAAIKLVWVAKFHSQNSILHSHANEVN